MAQANKGTRDPVPGRSGQGEGASPVAVESAITRALGFTPDIVVPENFAATVAARAVAQPAAKASLWTGWGPRTLAGSTALLVGALFALAPHASPSLRNLRFDAELLLLAELGGLLLFGGQVFFPE